MLKYLIFKYNWRHLNEKQCRNVDKQMVLLQGNVVCIEFTKKWVSQFHHH